MDLYTGASEEERKTMIGELEEEVLACLIATGKVADDDILTVQDAIYKIQTSGFHTM